MTVSGDSQPANLLLWGVARGGSLRLSDAGVVFTPNRVERLVRMKERSWSWDSIQSVRRKHRNPFVNLELRLVDGRRVRINVRNANGVATDIEARIQGRRWA